MRWRKLLGNGWLQALAALLLTASAIGLLVPTFQRYEPDRGNLIRRILGWRQLDWAPPISWGVHDVYEIDQERAVSRKAGRRF